MKLAEFNSSVELVFNSSVETKLNIYNRSLIPRVFVSYPSAERDMWGSFKLAPKPCRLSLHILKSLYSYFPFFSLQSLPFNSVIIGSSCDIRYGDQAR